MGAQLGLPDALKRRGLTVEVVPGWETRSAGSFSPRGAVCHWTAGPAGTLKRPSLAICTKGRVDLPGPLCNVYLDRNGVAVVVAAGRANHAGAGSWRGVTGNSSFFGTECEAAGPGDFTKPQRAAYPRVNAAYCDLGKFGPEMVCGHSEYATPKGRKTDINGYTMDDMRRDTAVVLTGRTITSPAPEDIDMSALYDTRVDNRNLFDWAKQLVNDVAALRQVTESIPGAVLFSRFTAADGATRNLVDFLKQINADTTGGASSKVQPVDPAEFANAMRPLLLEAVQAGRAADNAAQAEAIVDELTARLAS